MSSQHDGVEVDATLLVPIFTIWLSELTLFLPARVAHNWVNSKQAGYTGAQADQVDMVPYLHNVAV